MTMPKLPLLLAVLLSGCMRHPSPSRAPLEDDRTIVFPQFFESEAVTLGERDGTYELDGETLRALMIAANDFLPPGTSNPPCRNTQEAQRYRVIRRGDIIFVYIYEDHAYCGRQYPALDSGARYAISKDGRILRRVLDGHPEGPLNSAAANVDDAGFSAEPGVSPTFDALWNRPPDAGSENKPDGEPLPDGGSLEEPQ
jgi:hypothetical protein